MQTVAQCIQGEEFTVCDVSKKRVESESREHLDGVMKETYFGYNAASNTPIHLER